MNPIAATVGTTCAFDAKIAHRQEANVYLKTCSKKGWDFLKDFYFIGWL
jgi:hypothetical protein